MKIALLSGADPRSCKHGAVVRLLPGTWRFHLQGLVDSKLSLKVEDQFMPIADHHEMQLTDSTTVQLAFVNRGSEKFITAFAERI